jgi:thiol-disulfide isomerase/thioredoxin
MIPNTDDRDAMEDAVSACVRRRRGGRPPRALGQRLRWRFGLGLSFCAVVTIALAVELKKRFEEAPKVEPPFERLVDPGVGPVREFALRDLNGRVRTMADWANRPAIVLFLIATECPVSNGYAPEMSRLAHEFGPRGVLFFGIHTDPDLTVEVAASHAEEFGLDFPILLDPDAVVAREAGVHVTPEAVVLSPDGQVYYRGRIDDRYAPDGRHRPSAQSRELEAALVALVAGESPAITQTKAFGCPLLLRAKPDRTERFEKITFAQDVAPILWKHCARCHRPGEVAPFSLLTYRDAARRADFIRDVTALGRMPPWKPHAGVGVFLDAARLSTSEVETLRLWCESGCPPGDQGLLAPLPEFKGGWPLGRPDLVLTMPEPYVVPASGPDIYRSFSIPFPLDRDVAICGVDFWPGNRRVVHHSRLHLDTTGDARRREFLDHEPGFAAGVSAASFPRAPMSSCRSTITRPASSRPTAPR